MNRLALDRIAIELSQPKPYRFQTVYSHFADKQLENQLKNCLIAEIWTQPEFESSALEQIVV